VLACESSGGYEALLVTQAHAAGHPIARVNARQVRDFAKAKGRLAKTDTLDAEAITEFAQVFHPSPLSLPDPLQQELAGLAKIRAHILIQITQNNNLKETLSDKALLNILTSTIASLKKQEAKIQALIASKIKLSPALTSRVARLQEVRGIGFITAFLTALVVVRFLLDFVSRHGFAPFAWWRIAVGTLGLALIWAGVGV
jgi:transposase